MNPEIELHSNVIDSHLGIDFPVDAESVAPKVKGWRDLIEPDYDGLLYESRFVLDAETQFTLVQNIQNGTVLKFEYGNIVFGSESARRIVVVDQTPQAHQELSFLMHASEGCFRTVVNKFMALHHIPYSADTANDLLTPARIGGMQAVYRFDRSYNTRFITYAMKSAFNCVNTYWYENEDAYSRAASQIRNAQRIRNFITEYKDKNGTTPAVKMIMETLEIKRFTVVELLPTLYPPLEIDLPSYTPEFDQFAYADILADPAVDFDAILAEDFDNQDRKLIYTIMQSWISSIQGMSDPKEKEYALRRATIIGLLYKGKTNKEIAQLLHVTPQRVLQILPQARFEFQKEALLHDADLCWPWITRTVK